MKRLNKRQINFLSFLAPAFEPSIDAANFTSSALAYYIDQAYNYRYSRSGFAVLAVAEALTALYEHPKSEGFGVSRDLVLAEAAGLVLADLFLFLCRSDITPKYGHTVETFPFSEIIKAAERVALNIGVFDLGSGAGAKALLELMTKAQAVRPKSFTVSFDSDFLADKLRLLKDPSPAALRTIFSHFDHYFEAEGFGAFVFAADKFRAYLGLALVFPEDKKEDEPESGSGSGFCPPLEAIARATGQDPRDYLLDLLRDSKKGGATDSKKGGATKGSLFAELLKGPIGDELGGIDGVDLEALAKQIDESIAAGVPQKDIARQAVEKQEGPIFDLYNNFRRTGQDPSKPED